MECPARLEDVDLFGAGAQEHWYEAYTILHDQAPVLMLPGEGLGPGRDGCVLTKYEDIVRVVRDPVRFKPTVHLAIEAMLRQLDAGESVDTGIGLNAMVLSMATLRPTNPLYRQHRQELTDPWVGPGAVRHTEMITQVVDELLDEMLGKAGSDEPRSVEFVSQFARPLPQIVMAKVLGFPTTDLRQLEAWGTAMVTSFVHGKGHRNVLSREQLAEQSTALRAFGQYVAEHVEAKRRVPEADMISDLTTVTYRALGRKLTDVEIVGIVFAMVLGGLETTQYALVEQAGILCENPEVLKEIKAEPAKQRSFIEEAMRLRAPTQGLSTRVTTQEEVFQGVRVPEGTLLHLRFGAGNVDAAQYECPHEVVLDRKRVAGHLTFSQGPRTCPGASISRLEQSIAWKRLLERVATFRYAPGNDFTHQPGIMLGTYALHLELVPAG